MKRGIPKLLIIAMIGAVVSIISTIIVLYLGIRSVHWQPTFEELLEPRSQAPLIICLAIAGIGFVVAVISGIKYVLQQLAQQRKRYT